MDIKSIRTLVTIADHRSFKAAANILQMSLSNVSLQISKLEKDLGVKLFNRRARPPKLTEAGMDFVQRSRELLEQWDILKSSVSTNVNNGSLKVGAVHTAVAGGVSQALGQLRKNDPGLYIELQTGLTNKLIHDLLNHRIDCAVVTKTENLIDQIQFLPITREALGVIAHGEAKGRGYREVLQNNSYIRFNRRATLAKQIESELKQRRIEVNATMEVTTLDAVESLVKHGLGVSVVPLAKHVRSLPKGIKVMPILAPAAFRCLGLIVERDCPRMHLVKLLLAELVAVYQQ